MIAPGVMSRLSCPLASSTAESSAKYYSQNRKRIWG
jgi:hypothetical protein